MSTQQSTVPAPTGPSIASTPPAHLRNDGPNRLTMAGGWALLAICVLHTIVFTPHPWWAAWLSGPFRTAELPIEAVVQFWGLPGGFVVPGALLAAMIIGRGRCGQTAPGYIAPVLGVWAALCIWMVGPSGFLLVSVPITLLVIARVRTRRQAADDLAVVD